MWIRSKLKEKGKQSFKRFYWKSVLVCFISLILSAGVGSGVTSRIENSFSSGFNSGINSIYDDYDYDEDYYDDEDWFIIIRRKRYQMVSLLFFLNIMEL